MIERREDAFGAQVLRCLEDVPPEWLNLTVYALVEPIRANMSPERNARNSRKPAFNLFADEEIVSRGMTVQELEAPVDAVVIGDRDHVHASRFRHAVHRLRFGVAVASVQEPEMTGEPRVIRVQMQVRPHEVLRHNGFSSKI
jgi:hypothetical protein